MQNPVTLREISLWNMNDSEVEIPALQRGLVWSPRQVEFLWDSILRYFPIGGFVLSEKSDGTFYLMDGQQRFNAIKTAFEEPDPKSESIIWIELIPELSVTSTKTFFIKVTTKIHPWGFKNDESSSVLNSNEKRKALNEFGMEGRNIFKDSISLIDTYPVMSNFPLPLSFLLNANLDSENNFSTSIINKIERLSVCWKEKTSWNDKNVKINVKALLEQKFYPLIKGLLQEKPYSITYSVLSATSMEQETQVFSDQTNLEILFNRLNTGGTQITRADLQYSAIKAYWGDDFKLKIDSLAKDRMPPQTLSNLFLRLALTIKNSNSQKFENNLSVRQIRDYARNTEIKDFVENFILSKADEIIEKVENTLADLPPYLVMKILTERQDIYLLLMFFASSKNLDLKKIHASNLAMLLYWFSVDVTFCVNAIYEFFEGNVDFESIEDIILYLIENGKIRQIYSPDEIRNHFDPCSLLIPKIETQLEQFWEVISNFRRTDTFLIFAEKEFLKENFPNYIPASIKDWDKTNRPWDYDHIIPQSWSAYRSRSEPFKEIADYWLWRTGNFAAIPFEENRSKNAYSEYAFYEKNTRTLLFSKEFEKVHAEFLREEEQAKVFAQAVFDRTIGIYEHCFNYIAPCLKSNAKKQNL